MPERQTTLLGGSMKLMFQQELFEVVVFAGRG
jgi:hypothetical protein